MEFIYLYNFVILHYGRAELNEKLQECDNEDYAIIIGKKLKDVLNLKAITPQILHSLVEKITCKNDGTVHIQYSFVNQLQEHKKATPRGLVAFFVPLK